MGYQEMKEMPHALKPGLLLLTLLQIIFMASPGLRGFGWFVCLTSIIEFITAIGIFAAFFFDLLFIQSGQWSMLEMVLSAVFCVCSTLNMVYYFANIFYLFNFWFLLATAVSVLLVIAYGLQTLIHWTARTTNVTMSSTNNQATATPAPATYPAGVNPV